ncbi:MAG: hypothetical protein K9J83_04700 [Desulfarculaceae bacterium]|nr:hypothetical protein [Desulfarculaceae bacterium]
MSKNEKSSEKGDWEMLKHDPVPGYKTAFHIILTVAVIYFVYIFATAH